MQARENVQNFVARRDDEGKERRVAIKITSWARMRSLSMISAQDRGVSLYETDKGVGVSGLVIC